MKDVFEMIVFITAGIFAIVLAIVLTFIASFRLLDFIDKKTEQKHKSFMSGCGK